MTNQLKRSIVLTPLLGAVLLSGCVWKSDYDKVVMQNQQLQEQNDRQTSSRLPPTRRRSAGCRGRSSTQ